MAQQNLEAQSQGRKKRALEAKLAPGVRRLLSQIYRDVLVLYSAGAFIPDMTLYRSDWESLLANHYRRVGNEFLGIEQRSKFLIAKQIENEQTASAVVAAFILASKNRAIDQTTFILETTKKQIDAAIETGKMEAPKDLAPGSERNVLVATLAVRALRLGLKQRTAVIASVETQGPAENAKLITARAIAGFPVLPFQEIVSQPQRLDKTWGTFGDEDVRLAHFRADGQVRDQSEPFNVGGELLMVPGDTSLGATLGNIIECRCSALYSQARR